MSLHHAQGEAFGALRPPRRGITVDTRRDRSTETSARRRVSRSRDFHSKPSSRSPPTNKRTPSHMEGPRAGDERPRPATPATPAPLPSPSGPWLYDPAFPRVCLACLEGSLPQIGYLQGFVPPTSRNDADEGCCRAAPRTDSARLAPAAVLRSAAPQGLRRPEDRLAAPRVRPGRDPAAAASTRAQPRWSTKADRIRGLAEGSSVPDAFWDWVSRPPERQRGDLGCTGS